MSYPAYQQNLPHTFRCSNHPDREGVGICVSCRSVVCVECSTRVDRMNYCIRCLQAAAPRGRERGEAARPSAVLGIPLLLGAFLASALVFAVLGYLLSLVRHLGPGGVTAG